jgi:diguanylate cyclase (GGDEF)-like protein
MAYFDALTGLPNRRLFLDRLEQTRIASSRSQMWGALVMIDLDDLKGLNDSYGHDAGDQFLIEVARRLREQLRQADSVARMGGDEFVLVLADLGMNETEAGMQAKRVVEKVRLALSEPYTLPGMVDPYPGSASFGFSLFQGRDVTVQTLLKQADIAMYQAKDAGRNRVFMFQPEA